ncbi:unnamed protein product [Acanthoscelides obtectus]|uniref:MRG-binding protein n=1 Tax=Acanthoscelides obtectus TaxID=200917 RepID=A0A9P0KR42_ACAOB|nr:unnamed protein product [Acanthoscelides obtectus]CAK1623619.1 MRG/MORF4L-binding protein [Acanthoscelides obtectus]
MEEFEWTVVNEGYLLDAMAGHKPVGVNKYFQMAFICDKFCDNLKKDVASEKIWAHLETMYNLEALDESESIPFPNSEKEFNLPDADFGNLINKKETEDKHKVVTTPKGGRETPKLSKDTKKEDKPTAVKNQKEERRDSKEGITKEAPKTFPIAKKEVKKDTEKTAKEKSKPGRSSHSGTTKEESKSESHLVHRPQCVKPSQKNLQKWLRGQHEGV